MTNIIGGAPLGPLPGIGQTSGLLAAAGRSFAGLASQMIKIVGGTVVGSSTSSVVTITLDSDTGGLVPIPARSIRGPIPQGAHVIVLLYPPRGVLILGITDTQNTSTVQFTNPGTFTGATGYLAPPGLVAARIRVQGAGGGGGGAVATGVSQSSGGSGGQAGHYTEAFLLASQIGSGYVTVVVGAGGTAPVGLDGTAGGLSSFAATSGLVMAGGGAFGQADTAAGAANVGIGVPGGQQTYTGSGGSFGVKGEDGWPGVRLVDILYMPGRGGSSLFGTSHSALAPTGNLQGQPGDRGAGGGGSARRASVGALGGGAGGRGGVFIDQYFS